MRDQLLFSPHLTRSLMLRVRGMHKTVPIQPPSSSKSGTEPKKKKPRLIFHEGGAPVSMAGRRRDDMLRQFPGGRSRSACPPERSERAPEGAFSALTRQDGGGGLMNFVKSSSMVESRSGAVFQRLLFGFFLESLS